MGPSAIDPGSFRLRVGVHMGAVAAGLEQRETDAVRASLVDGRHLSLFNNFSVNKVAPEPMKTVCAAIGFVRRLVAIMRA